LERLWFDVVLLDGDYFSDFRNLLFEVAFDAHLQGHRRAGAALAGALETHKNLAVFGADRNKFDVSAVGLEKRTNRLDNFLHAGVESGGR
jgi:hypothetical protein